MRKAIAAWVVALAIGVACGSGPAGARFLTADPQPVDASSGQDFNRFRYANDNPYRYLDPDGRESFCFVSGVGCGLSPSTPELVERQTQAMGALSLGVLGAMALGPFAAPILADVPALGPVAAMLAHPVEATVGGALVAEGVAASGGGMPPSAFPAEALVVRGGGIANQAAARIDAAIQPSLTPGVAGFSAQCDGGTCLGPLGAALPNKQLGVTTVGEIRAAGGNVLPTPGRFHHVTVTDLPGDAASRLMKIHPNPYPRKDP